MTSAIFVITCEITLPSWTLLLPSSEVTSDEAVSNCCTTALRHGAQQQHHLLLMLCISQYYARRSQLALRDITSEVTLAHVISRKFTLWNLFAPSLCKPVISFNTTLDWQVFWQHCFKLVLLISSHLVSPKNTSICVKANYIIITSTWMCFFDQNISDADLLAATTLMPLRTTWVQDYLFLPAGSLTYLECLKILLTGINFFQLILKSITKACFTSLIPLLVHVVIQLYLMS